MCANYKSLTKIESLVAYFGVSPQAARVPANLVDEVWPCRLAPFIRLDENGRRCAETGNWGLLPVFAKEVAYGRNTYNSRAETAHSKNSFRAAWKRSQRCIVPALRVYEQNYETGKPVRWAVENENGLPMGVAGLWTDHPTLKTAAGEPVLSFTMLTVNADGHPVYSRFHAPGDEKRMPVFLDPSEHDTWLTCSPDEASEFFRQWQNPLRTYATPLPPRGKKPKSDDGESPPLLD